MTRLRRNRERGRPRLLRTAAPASAGALRLEGMEYLVPVLAVVLIGALAFAVSRWMSAARDRQTAGPRTPSGRPLEIGPERARQAGARRVELIPTVVDTHRYRPRQARPNETPVIGWIGTPNTSRYLQPLLPVFKALQARMRVRVVAVGARSEDFAGTPVETLPWSEETEVESIQQFDIGIMPLPDSPWERGKCGYKLIQCMACGVPVVASPVGVNTVIVNPGKNGLLARDDEWEEHLTTLLQDPELRRSFGAQGRKDVENWYSLEVQAPRLLNTIREAVS